MSGQLAGKICVVTGATRGIGRGCAIALAEKGATVYITGRSDGDGELTLSGSVAAIEQAGGIGIATKVDHANDDVVRVLGVDGHVRLELHRRAAVVAGDQEVAAKGGRRISEWHLDSANLL